MAEELIGMEDMEAIFEVTDSLGIHRESYVSNSRKKTPDPSKGWLTGGFEITLPSMKALRSSAASCVLIWRRWVLRPRFHA
ncbi:MAG: hypothetical protein Ct9H300mP11_24030 [Chloroflexota bacterium]|nr:MAG: hypothetical protein Ct9H300mP11_24030 [Chloroflexota bacterium]